MRTLSQVSRESEDRQRIPKEVLVDLMKDNKIITNIDVDFEGVLSSGKSPRFWNSSSWQNFH